MNLALNSTPFNAASYSVKATRFGLRAATAFRVRCTAGEPSSLRSSWSCNMKFTMTLSFGLFSVTEFGVKSAMEVRSTGQNSNSNPRCSAKECRRLPVGRRESDVLIPVIFSFGGGPSFFGCESNACIKAAH